jgi:hypothetical protein
MPRQQKPKGRPVKYTMPEQIPDSPENVLRAQFRKGQPKDPEEWEFMKEHRQREQAQVTPETEDE